MGDDVAWSSDSGPSGSGPSPSPAPSPALPAPPSSGMASQFPIVRVLKKIMQEDQQKWFHFPVDPEKADAPDYFQVITTPMDLGTIEKKIDRNEYITQDQVASDIRLTFLNALRYNPAGHSANTEARRLLDVFDNCYSELLAKLERASKKGQKKKQPPSPRPSTQPVMINESTESHFVEILQQLKASDAAAPFLLPVDPIAMQIPTYPDIVKNPMDISTVEKKLKEGGYPSSTEFDNDVKLIFSNCFLFNHKEHAVYKAGKKLSAVYGKLFKTVTEDLGGVPSTPTAKQESKKRVKKEREEPLNSPAGTTITHGTPVAVMPSNEYLFFDVIQQLKGSEWAGPFLQPVDPVKLGVPNYPDVIKNPMDLSTIEKKLREGEYPTSVEFDSDVRLMFNNCFLFNPKEHVLHKQGKKLFAIYGKLLKNLSDEPMGADNTSPATPSSVKLEPPRKRPKNPERQWLAPSPSAHTDPDIVGSTPARDLIGVNGGTPIKKERPERERSSGSSIEARLASLVTKLKAHPLIIPFLKPVDINTAPRYLELIKTPVDVSTIETKLAGNEYRTANPTDGIDRFLSDVALIWKNCKAYNLPASPLYAFAHYLEGDWDTILEGSEQPMDEKKVSEAEEGWNEALCQKVLAELKKMPMVHSWFLEPVNEDVAPGYHDVIQQPMCIKDITTKLKEGKYSTLQEFADDVRLIWKNCIQYNHKGDLVYSLGLYWQNKFEDLWAHILLQGCPRRRERKRRQEVVAHLSNHSNQTHVPLLAASPDHKPAPTPRRRIPTAPSAPSSPIPAPLTTPTLLPLPAPSSPPASWPAPITPTTLPPVVVVDAPFLSPVKPPPLRIPSPSSTQNPSSVLSIRSPSKLGPAPISPVQGNPVSEKEKSSGLPDNKKILAKFASLVRRLMNHKHGPTGPASLFASPQPSPTPGAPPVGSLQPILEGLEKRSYQSVEECATAVRAVFEQALATFDVQHKVAVAARYLLNEFELSWDEFRHRAKIKSRKGGKKGPEPTSGGLPQADRSRCARVLTALKQAHPAFVRAVDPLEFGLPTYFDVVKRPSSLETVERKLHIGVFTTLQEFVQDMEQIWKNAHQFFTSLNNQSEYDGVREQMLEKARVFEAEFTELWTNGPRPKPRVSESLLPPPPRATTPVSTVVSPSSTVINSNHSVQTLPTPAPQPPQHSSRLTSPPSTQVQQSVNLAQTVPSIPSTTGSTTGTSASTQGAGSAPVSASKEDIVRRVIPKDSKKIKGIVPGSYKPYRAKIRFVRLGEKDKQPFTKTQRGFLLERLRNYSTVTVANVVAPADSSPSSNPSPGSNPSPSPLSPSSMIGSPAVSVAPATTIPEDATVSPPPVIPASVLNFGPGSLGSQRSPSDSMIDEHPIEKITKEGKSDTKDKRVRPSTSAKKDSESKTFGSAPVCVQWKKRQTSVRSHAFCDVHSPAKKRKPALSEEKLQHQVEKWLAAHTQGSGVSTTTSTINLNSLQTQHSRPKFTWTAKVVVNLPSLRIPSNNNASSASRDYVKVKIKKDDDVPPPGGQPPQTSPPPWDTHYRGLGFHRHPTRPEFLVKCSREVLPATELVPVDVEHYLLVLARSTRASNYSELSESLSHRENTLEGDTSLSVEVQVTTTAHQRDLLLQLKPFLLQAKESASGVVNCEDFERLCDPLYESERVDDLLSAYKAKSGLINPSQLGWLPCGVYVGDLQGSSFLPPSSQNFASLPEGTRGLHVIGVRGSLQLFVNSCLLSPQNSPEMWVEQQSCLCLPPNLSQSYLS